MAQKVITFLVCQIVLLIVILCYDKSWYKRKCSKIPFELDSVLKQIRLLFQRENRAFNLQRKSCHIELGCIEQFIS